MTPERDEADARFGIYVWDLRMKAARAVPLLASRWPVKVPDVEYSFPAHIGLLLPNHHDIAANQINLVTLNRVYQSGYYYQHYYHRDPNPNSDFGPG